MSKSKQGSKRNHPARKALPMLGAAGLTLSLAGSASALPAVTDIPRNDPNDLTFGEEEIADVSLATFYVFDKESDGASPTVNLSATAVEVATAAEVAMAVTVAEAVLMAAVVTAVTAVTVAAAAVSVLVSAASAGGGAAAAAVQEVIGAGSTVLGSGALIRASLPVALRTLSASEKRWRAN